MARDLKTELAKLKESVRALSTMVEETLHDAVKAFTEFDTELAAKVIRHDDDVDRTEIRLEEECMRILALHQPVATNLRFVVTVLKINNDLERIGDLSSKIAKKVLIIDKDERVDISRAINIPARFAEMFESTLWCLEKAVESFVREDADLAYKVLIWDDEVDEAKHAIRKQLEAIQRQDPSQHIYLGVLLSVSRSLERIADHATNIAEDVIYMMQGRIIRHDNSELS